MGNCSTKEYEQNIPEKAKYKSSTLTGHTGRVWSANFSPNGDKIVTTDDITAKIWEEDPIEVNAYVQEIGEALRGENVLGELGRLNQAGKWIKEYVI